MVKENGTSSSDAQGDSQAAQVIQPPRPDVSVSLETPYTIAHANLHVWPKHYLLAPNTRYTLNRMELHRFRLLTCDKALKRQACYDQVITVSAS